MRGAWAVLVAIALAGCASSTPERSTPRPSSPRHEEWAEVHREGRTVRCFVVFPEEAQPAPAVLVIHENKGLTEWVRSVADRLAAEGFVAVAPDLLSGTGVSGGGTESYPDEESAIAGIYKLPPDQVTADLDAVTEYAKSLPGADGTISVAGFCWGGAQAFRYATHRGDLKAVYVFYGSAPDDPAALAKIWSPVYGFYGEKDARVNATIPATEERMREADKTYQPVTYPGAGHGFLRSGEKPDADQANRNARAEAWDRWLALLRRP
jgi:carboxymethylenebutenolidase